MKATTKKPARQPFSNLQTLRPSKLIHRQAYPKYEDKQAPGSKQLNKFQLYRRLKHYPVASPAAATEKVVETKERTRNARAGLGTSHSNFQARQLLKDTLKTSLSSLDFPQRRRLVSREPRNGQAARSLRTSRVKLTGEQKADALLSPKQATEDPIDYRRHLGLAKPKSECKLVTLQESERVQSSHGESTCFSRLRTSNELSSRKPLQLKMKPKIANSQLHTPTASRLRLYNENQPIHEEYTKGVKPSLRSARPEGRNGRNAQLRYKDYKHSLLQKMGREQPGQFKTLLMEANDIGSFQRIVARPNSKR